MGGGLSCPHVGRAGPGIRRALVACILLLVVLAPEARAHRAGLFCDGPDSTCFSGEGEFTQFAWVWTPAGTGLVYVTLRLSFPDDLQVRSGPRFDARVIEFAKTGYPDGTEEWHMVLEGCPGGWVRVFRQTVRLLDGAPSAVEIHGGVAGELVGAQGAVGVRRPPGERPPRKRIKGEQNFAADQRKSESQARFRQPGGSRAP